MAARKREMGAKAPPRTPRTAEKILALLAELEELHGGEDAQIKRLRGVRDMTAPVLLPDEYRLNDVEVRDPTITSELERIVPTFTLAEPSLTVKPAPRSGEAGETNATLRERWTQAVLRVAGTPSHGQPTLQAAVDACAGDGGAWTKLVWRNDLWGEVKRLREKDFEDDAGYPRKPGSKGASTKYTDAVDDAKREAGVPFAWMACDPLSVYPVLHGDELVEMVEVQQRPRLATLRRYKLGLNRDGEIVPEELADPLSETEGTQAGALPTIRFIEHWDPVWVTYVVAGETRKGKSTSQQVAQWRHGYGRVPYFAAFGRMVNWWKNRKVGWGISESKRYLVEYLSFLLTLHAQVACRDSLPPMYESIPDGAIPLLGEDGKPIRSEKWQPGEIRIGPPGGNLTVPEFPNSSANLEKHIALIQAKIEALDSPRAPANLGEADNGFATSLVMSDARVKHDPIGQAIERMLEQVTRFLWELVRTKVKEPVWVETGPDVEEGWLAAGPDDLTPGVSIQWTINAEKPNAQLVEARYWHERVRERTASRHQAIEAMGDNPDEVDEALAWEEVRDSPQYKALRLQRIMEKVNRGDLLRQAVALTMAQTGQVPGVPGVPGAPQGFGQMGGPPPGAPPAMGNGQVPDMGALTAAPGGAPPGGPVSGSVPGVSTGAGPPQRSAAPLANLGR